MGSLSQIGLTHTHISHLYTFSFFDHLIFHGIKEENYSLLLICFCVFFHTLSYIYIYIYIDIDIYISSCLGQKVRSVLTNQLSSSTSTADSGNFQTPLRSQACSATAEAGHHHGNLGKEEHCFMGQDPMLQAACPGSFYPMQGLTWIA